MDEEKITKEVSKAIWYDTQNMLYVHTNDGIPTILKTYRQTKLDEFFEE